MFVVAKEQCLLQCVLLFPVSCWVSGGEGASTLRVDRDGESLLALSGNRVQRTTTLKVLEKNSPVVTI